MPGRYQWSQFSDINIEDPFFDSLKTDYGEFPIWFKKKCDEGERALVLIDEEGVGAFVYLKEENEPIVLSTRALPAIPRIKIGTLRIAERFQGQRFGEGALGVSLWKWQESKCAEIYVTVFEKHSILVSLFERFGFNRVGMNRRGECIYVKSREKLDYSDPYKSFPFISPNIDKAGILSIYERYHDKLFPYSELKGNTREIEEETAGNGITKVYIATPSSSMHYFVGEPVGVYRIYDGQVGKTYKSVVTSYCTITRVDPIKTQNVSNVNLETFIQTAGNKTIFGREELIKIYKKNANVVMLEMVYNGFFGKGHNVNHKELTEQGLFTTHPYQIELSKEQFIRLLKIGGKDVQNIIID